MNIVFAALISAIAAASTDVMGVCPPLHRKTTERQLSKQEQMQRYIKEHSTDSKPPRTKGAYHKYTKAKDNTGKSKIAGAVQSNITTDSDLFLENPKAKVYLQLSNEQVAALRNLTVQSEFEEANE